MDITKGSLDDISRPASSERTRPGSRVSSVVLSEGVRMNQDRIGALEILSSELSETKDQPNIDCPSENLAPDQDVFEDENKDPELQKAFMEIKRLDRILASKISNEKEVKKQGRELHQRLWKELKDHRPERSSEYTHEAENTRLFLALTFNISKDCTEEVDYVPVFGTQLPDQENDISYRSGNKVSGSEVGVHDSKSSNTIKVGPELKEVKEIESRQSVMGKSKHGQDFIKKNIELASSAGSLGPMTQEEKEQLEELLRDIDEEDTYVDPTDKSEDKKTGELGERVLKDMKELKEQEECLCEIQQQLQLLTQRQHPDSLTEKQMKSLLLECEMALSKNYDSGEEAFSDSKPFCIVEGQIISLLASTPHLSSSAFSEMLQEACGTPTSPDQELKTQQQETQVPLQY